ncbi:MAG: hypothetical protein LBS09_03015 [Bacteroidales bacterium]|nr:hypothetical protein [Bacteroidales bacterium]
MYNNILEEELKNKVAADWFQKFDCTQIVGKIDFCVGVKKPQNSLFGDALLWAEAKQTPHNIYTMFAQLLLTINKDGKNKMPPKFLGCFDNEKIAFIEYHYALPIFNLNDFDWTQTPSKVNEKTVEQVRNTLPVNHIFSFYFDKDAVELKNFIKQNFVLDETTNLLSTQIDKNNFIFIYQKWHTMVMPFIEVNWDLLKKNYSIYARDFFLAEMNIDDKGTTTPFDDSQVENDFYMTFDANASKQYRINRKDGFGLDFELPFGFRAGGLEKYVDFWKRYKRPPQKEYWDYIVSRLDLLVPQDVRERKGAFFTPPQWVELSQKYIADVLGVDWQDEYYVWDCAAGTGNLLDGLSNKYNIWASTIDQQDVAAMQSNARKVGDLLESHIFQFDFLNDEFTKLPQGLQDIINDEDKRKKLVIYINPPYAEADNRKGEGRSGVAITKVHEKYANKMGYTKRELYIQFLTRIYCEIYSCMLADFSTLKNLQAPRFLDFRKIFRAKLEKIFLVPAKTFDNVKGDFPIGFKIWNTSVIEDFRHILADVYDEKGFFCGEKNVWAYDNVQFINDWVKTFRKSKSKSVATIIGVGSDFQNQRLVRFGEPYMKVPADNHNWQITQDNFIQSCIYFAVRHCIPADWLNDRDQFLYPNEGWQNDTEFQNDCLCYALFNNNIQSKYGVNNWIPFTESEVNAHDKFASNFMTHFIAGKRRGALNTPNSNDLFANNEGVCNTPLQFSPAAAAVFDAGRELWRYYHSKADVNVNASLYDIREYFQGRNDKGKMNATSDDEKYTTLIAELRSSLRELARKIEPKVYEYGFLRE